MTGKPLAALTGRKYAVDGWDMGRMLKFIEQESEQKAHEIDVQSNEDYGVKVAEMAVESMKRINKQKEEEIEKIRSERVIAEGILRSKAGIAISKQKEQTMNRILNSAMEKCRSIPLRKSLAEDAIRRYRHVCPNEKMFVYVKQSDAHLLKSILKEGEYAVETMGDSLLGGIVIRNEDRTVLINNSYLERIRCIEREAHPIVQRLVFSK
ncbi:V-type H+-transporting ATPase subunit E [Nematocida major]|uniref:V-type H+-transporting ATPase subunit E n=1 Tax=Nematocida major TaxID=1912982 RepID=UPI0020080D76|nr:V-type H+-transporting ATPase subunit E [Nematocida major]KAH9387265.1 V-type H+-transporting ATPase subunit E [Nematocida major]